MESYYQNGFKVDIIEGFTDFRTATDRSREGKGKFFGAGYEVFIYAFFIGLYSGERKKLIGPKSKFRMTMGSWGSIDTRKQQGRQKYTEIQKYIFMALIAKSDIDLLALDKGELTVEEAVKILMTTLSEYANQGLHMIRSKKQEDPQFFFNNDAFLVYLKEVLESEKKEDTEYDSMESGASIDCMGRGTDPCPTGVC